MFLQRSFQLLLVALLPLCRADADAAAAASSDGTVSSLTMDANSFASQSYDYVVIGSGPGGMAVASRLSEVPWITVALIDAGVLRSPDAIIDVPKNFGRANGQVAYDWMYTTVPQAGANNRKINQPRGKVLGGSSAINFEIFNRGHADEYDAWEDISEGQQWDHQSLFPYFKRVENFTPPPANVTALFNKKKRDAAAVDSADAADASILTKNTGIPSGYAVGGPVQVSNNDYYTALAPDWLATMKNLGISYNSDPAGGNNVGLYNSGSSVDRRPGQGVRSYAGVNYVHNRPNLKILQGAIATKLVFNGKVRSNVVASGVQYQTSQGTFTVNANREVIVSGGVFESPKLLELSGIGQAARLQKLGIQSVVDLPGVGENLQDHPMLTSVFNVKPGIETWDRLRIDTAFATAAAAQYNATKNGVMASTISILAFLPLMSYLPTSTVTTLINLFKKLASATGLTPLQQCQYNIQLDWLNAGKVPQLELVFAPSYLVSSWGQPAGANASYLAISAAIQHPFARGSSHISTSDYTVKPDIDLQFLNNEYDMQMAVEALKFSRKIAQTPPLSNDLVGFFDPTIGNVTDADFANYAAKSVESLKHPVGTCAMAPREKNGVVDTTLFVYGTTNVRVCDASIIPLHISAHTQATAYGIGEKCAGMIKFSLGVS